MRNIGYLVSIGLLLVVLAKIGQSLRGAVRRRRVQGVWAHKRDEWLQNLHVEPQPAPARAAT
jgi:hypothetical protein